MRLLPSRNQPSRGSDHRPTDPTLLAERKKMALLLLFNSAVILTLYFVLNSLNFWPIFFIYMGVAAVLIVVYVIYNRGFVYKDATPEMLSEQIPYEERLAILEEAKARLKKSKWMLTLIIPFLLAFISDMLYLFFLEGLLESMDLLSLHVLLRTVV